MRPAAIVAVSNILMALPAHADAGKIFDFNLTLPIMAGQFLLLMVFLDKFWFGPVGKVLDERDGYIREQLQKFKVSPSHLATAHGHHCKWRKGSRSAKPAQSAVPQLSGTRTFDSAASALI